MSSEVDWLYEQWFDELGQCGCGMPDAVYELVRDTLALMPLYDHRAEIVALIGDGPIAEFYLNVLSDAELIEHGSSVGGSWITDKGKRMLAAMQAHSYDEMSDEGYGVVEAAACGDRATWSGHDSAGNARTWTTMCAERKGHGDKVPHMDAEEGAMRMQWFDDYVGREALQP